MKNLNDPARGAVGRNVRAVVVLVAGLLATVAVATPAAAKSGPVSVDWRNRLPVPINQGNVGACATYATVYVMGSFWARTALDPLPTYARVLAKRAAAGEALFAQRQGVPMADVVTDIQTNGAYRAVGKVRPRDWHELPARAGDGGHFKATREVTTVTAVRQALASGPVVLILHGLLDSNLPVANEVRAISPGDSSQSHAVAAVGYDDRGVTIQNSYGADWGKAGYATIPWKSLNTVMVEAWIGKGWTQAPAAQVAPR